MVGTAKPQAFVTLNILLQQIAFSDLPHTMFSTVIVLFYLPSTHSSLLLHLQPWVLMLSIIIYD